MVYRVSTKKSGSASEWIHQTCSPGPILELRAPAGKLHLPSSSGTSPNRRQVFISAGIGIAPFFTMLKSHLPTMPSFVSIFLHATQDSAHHPFRPELNSHYFKMSELAFYTKHLPKDVLQNDDHCGNGQIMTRRPTRAAIERLLFQAHMADNERPWPALSPALQMCEFYICGPITFEVSIRGYFAELRVPSDLIHNESFTPATRKNLAVVSDLEEAAVLFSESNIKATWRKKDGKILLELAEDSGLHLPFGCRTGDCGACVAQVICGEVRGGICEEDD